MERAVFDRMAEQDEVHWWYVARRAILRELIARKANLPPDARLLEIGCGTGHNFDMLREFGRLDAVEVDGQARALAVLRSRPPVDALRALYNGAAVFLHPSRSEGFPLVPMEAAACG